MPSSTTEIYTLSLHDALPIWIWMSNDTPRMCSPTKLRIFVSAWRGMPEGSCGTMFNVTEPSTRCTAWNWRVQVASSVNRMLNRIDRKSTRLNSSHVEISYAVFYHRDLHSFPTRRSSDLDLDVERHAAHVLADEVADLRLRLARDAGGLVRDDVQRHRAVDALHGLELARAGRELGEQDVEQDRSEEHTSELQSRRDIVCRLLPPRSTLFPYTTLFRSGSGCRTTRRACARRRSCGSSSPPGAGCRRARAGRCSTSPSRRRAARPGTGACRSRAR